MRQLSGVDTSFLHMEDARVTGHVGGLIIVDPSTAEYPIDVDTVKKHIAERIPVLAPLRRKLVEVPLGIDLPYWIDDHDVDLDFHVRGLALPAPGNEKQLVDQVSRLHARPLDRAHPLWEVYVIEGLEGGRVAIYTKLHHAAIDGKAGMRVIATLLSPSPRTMAPEPPAEMPPSETRPSELEMLTRGWMGVLSQPNRALELMVRGAAEWHRSLQSFGYAALGEAATGATSTSTVAPKPAPRLSFNKSLTARRNWAFGSVSLEQVKWIKNKQDCTINDVVMALCAGALRAWMLAHDELPEDPIRALVPVSIRTAEKSDTAGNQVSAMVADLPTNLSDPLARLEATHSTMRRAKEDFAALPAGLLQEFAQFAAPAAAELVARTAASLQLAEKTPLPFNVVISNVPGPREPLYYAGALMEANYPVSMISDGMGLNITLHSYRDNLDFGLVSCPELIPDLPTIIDHLRDELSILAAL